MSAAAGAAFARPLCGADHVIALLQSAAFTSSSGSSGIISGGLSRKGTTTLLWSQWPLHRQGIPVVRNKADSFGFLGQQDGVGFLAEGCKSFPRAPEQRIRPCIIPRSRVREGEADSGSKGRKRTFKKESSLLLNLVQEIQPLDVNIIGKGVSPDSTDAMKRTISGMLGLLPSDQFHVTVETSCEPLAKLFVSSMMTGYTLRNAEYRLCLQKSLEVSADGNVGGGCEVSSEHSVTSEGVKGVHESGSEEGKTVLTGGEAVEVAGCLLASENGLDHSQFLGSISAEARQYIHYLEQKVASVTKELEECKRINTGLQVQSIVDEEKNDLLDYLRSLPPDKVAELSQPTSPEVEEVIQEVINGLLDSTLTKLQLMGPQCGNEAASDVKGLWEEEGAQKFFTSPFLSQSTVSVNRDYLARLLFWCMLFGHHMRGLEYRLELSRTLSLSGDLDFGGTERNQVG